MSGSSSNPRRRAIKNMVVGSLAMGTTAGAFASASSSSKEQEVYTMKGNINHSVCRWCYGGIPLEELCAGAKKMGIVAIDLVGPKDWPVLQKHGLYSSMCNGVEINL